MKSITVRERLLASSMICGAAFMAMSATQAQAAAAAAAPATSTEVEEIVVTGSLFRRTDTETPSPVTVVTSVNLQRAGIVTASDAIRQVSADGAGSIGTGFTSGFSAGGSAVSLRGLGVSSTLVLVDGLRSTNFPISDDGHNAYTDLNSIPFSLIDRVEVLKDGASSSYGADAIGGVVNLILKKHVTGIHGSLEGGQSYKNDADHHRADLTVGYGDYDTQRFNVYLNGEFQRDGRFTAASRGFPYNTLDLSSIGGLDQNTADSTLTTATPNAVVARVAQTDLNNPLAGGTAVLSNQYQSLNLNCANGTYTVTTGGAQGTGCKHDLLNEYGQLAPLQKRYSFNGRASLKISDNIEGYVTGSYSRDFVSIRQAPRAIRQTQAFGATPSTSTSNPGIVLPVYVCSTGVNCATAADRRLNPNNPFAAAFANDPANGAARIYYLFGDVPSGSDRVNEVYRGTAGLNGNFGDDWNWKIDAVAARDNLKITQLGYANLAGLVSAINTGSYNFVNPQLNSQAVRNAVLPNIVTPSHSSMYSVEGSITHKLMELSGGDLQLAVGAQARREALTNNTQNPTLQVPGLTTAQAYGKHTVTAAYFELDAPVIKMLDITMSGRYDHYSEGFSHFSPKIGFKLEPIKQLAFRGTYSKGFRAPTFAESGTRSQYSAFSTFTPPAAFQIAHGGLVASGNTNPYAQSYSLAQGLRGFAGLKPELSRSYTLGVIAQPVSWISLTADYYNVKKSGLIAAAPDIGIARNAYYAQSNETAGCAAVAAVGPGYACNLLDAIDPLNPTAMRRVLIIDAPFVNSNFFVTTGFDVSATASIPITDDLHFTSKIEVTHVIKANLHTVSGQVQKYAGTLGPYELSSGNGTPDWRGNWQNTLEFSRFSLSATANYVGKIKSVAADERTDLTCATGNQYATGNTVIGNQFCYIKRFISVDMNGSVKVNDNFSFYADVGNVFNTRAPIAPGAYTSAGNTLLTFHSAGQIGRTYKAGIRFDF